MKFLELRSSYDAVSCIVVTLQLNNTADIVFADNIALRPKCLLSDMCFTLTIFFYLVIFILTYDLFGYFVCFDGDIFFSIIL